MKKQSGSVKMRLLQWLFFAWISSTSGLVLADASDVEIASGFAIGTVKVKNKSGKDASYNLGGIPLAVTWNGLESHRYSLGLRFSMLLDLMNKQLNRQSFEGLWKLHLFGGGRRIASGGPGIQYLTKYQKALSFISGIGFDNYTASDPQLTSSKIDASVVNILAGVEYRMEISDNSAISLAFLTAAYSIPKSVERIEPSIYQGLIGWRSYY
jgi:hypothetical protein